MPWVCPSQVIVAAEIDTETIDTPLLQPMIKTAWRKQPRPGRVDGVYDVMRGVLATDCGGGLYARDDSAESSPKLPRPTLARGFARRVHRKQYSSKRPAGPGLTGNDRRALSSATPRRLHWKT